MSYENGICAYKGGGWQRSGTRGWKLIWHSAKDPNQKQSSEDVSKGHWV